MADWHAQQLTTLAFLWRVERADGITLCFTLHDRDLSCDGYVYCAAPAVDYRTMATHLLLHGHGNRPSIRTTTGLHKGRFLARRANSRHSAHHPNAAIHEQERA